MLGSSADAQVRIAGFGCWNPIRFWYKAAALQYGAKGQLQIPSVRKATVNAWARSVRAFCVCIKIKVSKSRPGTKVGSENTGKSWTCYRLDHVGFEGLRHLAAHPVSWSL